MVKHALKEFFSRTVVKILLVVLFMVFWPKKLNAKVPWSLLAISLATIVTEIAGFDSLAKVGDIPKSLMLDNRLNLGAVNLDMLQNLVSPIVSIAMLGMIESLLCGASASRMKDEDIQTLVQIRDTIQSVLQFVQTAAQSDDAAASPAA